MTDFVFQVDGFMLFCTSKNLSKKSLKCYEQSLHLFGMFLSKEFGITEVGAYSDENQHLFRFITDSYSNFNWTKKPAGIPH